MKKNLLLKFCLVIIAVGLIATHTAGAADLRIGAMGVGTSWYIFGATLAKLLQPVLPAGSNVEVMARGGAVSNPIAVEQGKIQIGLTNVATAVWAWEGNPVVYKGVKHQNIRSLVGGLNPLWFNAMIREDYIKKTGNDTLEKALLSNSPPRIVMKPAGSFVPVVADMVMEALGTDRKKIQANGGQIIQADASQIPSLLRDDRADLYFEGVTMGHPAVTEATLTTDFRFLDMPEKVIVALAKQGCFPSSMPKQFKGQTGPTKVLDIGTQLVAHKDMPEDLAYLITKTICENKEAMAQGHKAWANFDPKVAGKPENTGIPLHPGAERYYREKGWL